MNTKQIRRFRRSLRQFERLSTSQLKRCCTKVTFAQCLVLLEIDERGSPTMSELAQSLRLDTSTLSRSIEGLVGKGLVDRKADASDRRRVRIVLTDQGRAQCQAIHHDNDACVRDLFAKIVPSQHQSVIGNFEVLVRAFLDWERDPRCSVCETERSLEQPEREVPA